LFVCATSCFSHQLFLPGWRHPAGNISVQMEMNERVAGHQFSV
jgi:hypothetical protein